MDLDLANDDLLPIVQIESNQICNDCGKINPHWCSITNAIFLCPSCVRTHKKFNKKISIIKSLEVDDWSKEELSILKIGGNERFNNLIKSYNIPLTKDNKEYKYYTKAAQYYRDILLAEAKNKDIKNIIKPSLREGIEILYQDEYLNLFNKDQLKEQNTKVETNCKNQIKKTENKNWMDKMIDKLEPDITPLLENQSKGKQFLNNMMYAFNDVKERTKEIDFKGKFKKAGEFVQDKTEQIQNSNAFNRFMNVFSTGIDNVIQTTDKLLFKNDSKIFPIPPNYLNQNLIQNNNIQNINNINNPNNINQMKQSNYAPIINNQNQNIINNINTIDEKNKNSEPNSIKKEEEKNNIIQNDLSQPKNEKEINNKEEKLDEDEKETTKKEEKLDEEEKDNIKKEEKLDEEEKVKKDKDNNKEIEEKLDENEENDPSLLIMSNIPNHN